MSNNTDKSERSRQEVNIRAGHIFSRNFPFASGIFNISATQRASTILDTTGKMNRTLSHTIGSGWNKSLNKATYLARLTLSDTRRFSQEDDEFGLQQANLQFTSNYQVNRDSSLNGNITFQANRTLENSGEGDNTDLNSSVSINYTQNRLFNVQRLRLLSELRYLSDSLFEVINSDGFNDNLRNEVFWQNRFNYDIGRLSFRLTANIGQTNGEFNNFLLLQVRRNFGR